MEAVRAKLSTMKSRLHDAKTAEKAAAEEVEQIEKDKNELERKVGLIYLRIVYIFMFLSMSAGIETLYGMKNL